jgi:hypothetical protein
VSALATVTADRRALRLAELDGAFGRWLGVDYDLDAIHATLAVAAVNRLDGDPAWLLIVGGPGNAKTETVSALGTSGAHVVSTIASEGALLSGTSMGERSSDATGGLLRVIGDSGVLVLKDFTSILSLPPSARPSVLAALREIYDGHWTRTLGADGGRSLEWSGRIAVIGAVTTAWDSAHTAVSAMGDRFVLLRLDSSHNRIAGGRQAAANTGSEIAMRRELGAAVKAVLDTVDTNAISLDHHESDALLAAADLVTLARTAVERDRQGNVTYAHAAEMPTRFVKQLTQIVRGAVAIGMDRDDASRLAIRCARDSMPPLRLAIIEDLTAHPRSTPSDVRKHLQKPHNTVDRELQALHMLGLVTLHEEMYLNARREERTRWRYSLAEGTDATTVFPNMYVPPLPHEGVCTPTYIPGKSEHPVGRELDPRCASRANLPPLA